MTLTINVLEEKYYNFLSDHPDDIKFSLASSIDELLNKTGPVLLTHSLLIEHLDKIYANRNNAYILYMPLEGTNTVNNVLKEFWDSNNYRMPFVISSGDFNGSITHINIDAFKTILGRTSDDLLLKDWETCNNIFTKTKKPFLFNFLNGVSRSHRTELIRLLENKGILNLGLWTALYNKKFLPAEYQFEFEEKNIENGQYINNGWPAGIIHPPIYEDTYFSVVCETNFEIPNSYRTEKIYKPLKIGHPFIAVSSYGFYKDLHNMGFKTFGNLIDESFDTIDDNHLRLVRIADVIESLCKSNLVDFLTAAESICRHNRAVMLETLNPRDDKTLLSQFMEKFNWYAKTK